MAFFKIDHRGTKRYYNDNNEWHREDGPAVIWKDGARFWYRDGRSHCTNGPAEFWETGRVVWKRNGTFVPNRMNIDSPSGFKLWCVENGRSTWPKLQ